MIKPIRSVSVFGYPGPSIISTYFLWSFPDSVFSLVCTKYIAFVGGSVIIAVSDSTSRERGSQSVVFRKRWNKPIDEGRLTTVPFYVQVAKV